MDAKRRGKFRGADLDIWMGRRGWRRPLRGQLLIRPKRNRDIEYVLGYLGAKSEMAYAGNKRPNRTYHKAMIRHIPTFELNLAATA